MNKAKDYALPVAQEMVEKSRMYWIHDENTCPEMQMAIRMAENDFAHLWPENVSDLSVAELIFHIMALEKTIQDETEENARLREENSSLESRLKKMVPLSPVPIPNESMAPVNEVSMYTVCDATVTPSDYYKPVPGVNTILACAERTEVDEEQSTAVTTKVCQGIGQLARMFYDSESVQQSQANENVEFRMRDPAVEAANQSLIPKPPVPLRHCNDENSSRPCRVQMLKNEPLLPRFMQNDLASPEIPLGNRPVGLKLRKEEYEQPPRLQIFKDPEGLACRGEGIDVQQQRHPLRTLKARLSPTKQQALQDVDVENLAPRCFPPLHENFSQLDLTGSRIDLVPCCASTAMFSVSPLPAAPISGGINPISSPTIEPKLKMQQERLQPVRQEFKVDDNGMAKNNVTQSPDQSNSRLAAAFNQFVHSPDQNGRLRIDATKFMEAFLTKRPKNPTGEGDRRGPPMF
ncbi:hypothetical protein Aperf_G00000083959 [Anoplocephala perfoliata]